MKYSKNIDVKWQKKWKEDKIYKYNKNGSGQKFYNLEMFPYPSGASLHLGHWFNFAPADSFARYKKMKGYNVFHPMGFDSFGLPAENYAIKTGISPKISTEKNIETMKRQLEEMGVNYDWDYSVETSKPEYYKWTQWIFTKLFEKGLAYKKNSLVNWCDSCKTVLANEQVIDYKCERCGTEVKKKKLEQWFFKITDYAEELLTGLDNLNWPETTKKIQKNWIGKSEGAEIKFKYSENKYITVFTTRADTLNGVTYIVLAPESDLVKEITTEDNRKKVEEYISETLKLNEIERLSVEKEKTGVFTGSYAINPINNEKVPIWIADYVLEDYGTGAVMAVPAHDDRDYAFANKYKLPIKKVIESEENMEDNFTTLDGVLVNSGKYDGLKSDQARNEIVEDLKKIDLAEKVVNYRLKDWLVSRQRYWGAPIPVINCPDCGAVAVPEKDLPVILPDNVEFKPDGVSPLKKSEEFINCVCPNCGKPAKREAETLDTFVCSSWYQFRYLNPHNDEFAIDEDLVNKMCPVDVYVGGKEHAAMHLIYSRFITKVLRDLGYVKFDEPFKKLIHQGLILGPDGNKMSKSKGNTVSPDTYIDKYGSDVFRMYLMFGFEFTKGGPWDENGIDAMAKYFGRIERIIEIVNEYRNKENNYNEIGENEKDLLRFKNKTIQAMDIDISEYRFNTAIARSMELTNKINDYLKQDKINFTVFVETVETLICLLSPLAPHFTQELWIDMGKIGYIYNEKYPKINEEELQGGKKQIPIQVNGKLKFCVEVDNESNEKETFEIIKKNQKVIELLENNIIIKEIYVPNKIFNIVIKK